MVSKICHAKAFSPVICDHTLSKYQSTVLALALALALSPRAGPHTLVMDSSVTLVSGRDEARLNGSCLGVVTARGTALESGAACWQLHGTCG